ncbi:hypothetical protein MY10362_002770 [Beauveria mimosiformis]
MSSIPYLQSITSQTAFDNRSVAEQAPSFANFTERTRQRVGSLPLLAGIENPEQLGQDMDAFINGPDYAHLSDSELALVSRYGHSLGQVWAALAMFRGPPARRLAQPFVPPAANQSGGNGNNDDNGNNDGSGDPAGRPKRARRNTQQPGFVDSSTMEIESSSPIQASSQGSSMGYFDEETHTRAAGSEDETLRLITCALRHVLYFAPPHNKPDMSAVVEVRDAKVRLKTRTQLGHSLVAVDDGGLCLRRLHEGVYQTNRKYVLMLETKNKLQCFHEGRPIISDACLAQMTCQALTAKIADPLTELVHGRLLTLHSVIILHAAQHYVCFLQFDIPEEYLDDLESVTPTAFLQVSRTHWYNLDERGGRSNFVRIIRSIMKWA